MAWDGYGGLAVLACVVNPSRCEDPCLFRCIQFRGYFFVRMESENPASRCVKSLQHIVPYRNLFGPKEYAVMAPQAISYAAHLYWLFRFIPGSVIPSRMIRNCVIILIPFALREYRAVDRSADPKGKLQLTVL